jgi:glycosyltransferase involved in cell wall biosynthesis
LTSGERAIRRVVHLIDHMGSGGAQRVILELLEARGPGRDAAVVSLRSHCLPELRERMDACGVSYRGLGLSRRNPLPLHRIRCALREARPDVVHSHLEFSNALGVLATRSLGRSRPPVIVHVHNDPRQQYSWPHRWAGRILAPWTDTFLAPSKSVAEAARDAFGPGMGRVEVIPSGIDPAWLDRGPSEASVALRQGASPVIGTVARLAPQKSVHDLIEAMPFVLEARPTTRLLIFGDGPLSASLEARGKNLGVDKFVTFAGFAHDVAAAYAALDVFVLPSQYEGLPICLLEVMAMGIPVVGTRVPGISELVEDGRTGLVVPHGNPKALATAVLRLLSNEPLRDQVRAAARRQIERSYTRSSVAERVEALYTDLCSNRGAAEA